MKYFLFLSVLFGLTSCSLSNPFREDLPGNPSLKTDKIDVRVSDSGASTSSDTGNISVVVDSGGILSSHTGVISVSESGNIVGTGAETVIYETDGMGKDSEIRDIMKDIDKIFSEIEKGE